ncbi:MAG: ATP-dependent DNA ligase [Cytophagaceae bacterium]|nr:ATP-dependent DNA ligase [Gemmatimonadaceae bacterium]
MGTPEFPEWLVPMAATLTAERFTGEEWVFERKLDGIRLLAYKQGADVRLWSRNRLPQDGAYPAVVEAVRALPYESLILDGEATGVWGRAGRTAYHVFDVLWLDGDVTGLPYMERSALLDSLPMRAPMERVERVTDAEPWVRACREGWEGVIAKRRESPYEHRRSKHWLKMKCEASQEFVAGGYTDPQGKRVGLGALLVGYYDQEEFVFAGKVGTGFDTKLLLDLRERFNALAIASSPFTRATGLPRLRAHWVRPEIVVQVAFIEWTVHGKLRHSRLLGVRTDKAPHEVIRASP